MNWVQWRCPDRDTWRSRDRLYMKVGDLWSERVNEKFCVPVLLCWGSPGFVTFTRVTEVAVLQSSHLRLYVFILVYEVSQWRGEDSVRGTMNQKRDEDEQWVSSRKMNVVFSSIRSHRNLIKVFSLILWPNIPMFTALLLVGPLSAVGDFGGVGVTGEFPALPHSFLFILQSRGVLLSVFGTADFALKSKTFSTQCI